MAVKFRGLIAPVETPTGDGRIFQAGKMTTRQLPLPLMARFTSGGHEGGSVVGKITKVYDGPGGYWCEGEFLDPAHAPDAHKAIYMLGQKVLGPSVDLDRNFTVTAISHPTRPGKQAGLFSAYNVIGVTLVPMPAFSEASLSVDSQDEADALMASLGLELAAFDVNPGHWKNWPLAPREYTFDADNAVQRIAAWAGIGSKEPSVDHYASTFLWRDGSQAAPTLAQDSFRLPLADIINGQPHLIYHAAYAAAALLKGAHGGLPNIPDADKQAMVPAINDIYAHMREKFGDPGMKSPFEGGGRQGNQVSASLEPCDECDDEFAAKKPYGNVKYADPGFQADKKARYPIDTADHVRAAWSYINQSDNAGQYTSEQLTHIKDAIKTAAKKFGVEIADEESGETTPDKESGPGEMALLAGAGWCAPSDFADPKLTRPTPVTIEGKRVYGHLATWKVCHVGIGDACVLAPHSKTDYSLFKVGQVELADGTTRRVGKITLGTGHANAKYGMIPARDHYDNSGWCAAVVNVGEDKHGIWVSGTLTENMTDEKVAELRRSPLSGDWRRVNGNLELVAALAVNSPGFPVYREEDGEAFALVAAGMVEPDEEEVESVEEAMAAADRAVRLQKVKEAREFALKQTRAQQLKDVVDERAKMKELYDKDQVAIQMNAKFVHVAE